MLPVLNGKHLNQTHKQMRNICNSVESISTNICIVFIIHFYEYFFSVTELYKMFGLVNT